MKLVTRNHLENWADTTFSKSTLPYLILRLIRATTPISTKANLPSGSATYIGGWDGIVNCEINTPYVPEGVSLWEFGTSTDPKGKADDDYKKRVENPLGFNASECVFVFATPRLWSKKDEWIKEKRAENYWKDVIVYDSIDIEQWLDLALSVSRWLAAQDGVDSYPFDGIMTADEFWEEWSIGKITLRPECITSGRDYERNLLLAALQGEPTIKGIKASTKYEAIAFIIASAKTFPIQESDRFFSKSLIVDTEGNFRGIRINTSTPLNLIPRFDEAQPLYAAVAKGHHVLVPLGADDSFNQETITLPAIDREGQIKSLIESGLSREESEKFSRESGRNMTILRKLLDFPYYKAKWVEREDIREIIPAILLGRWSESFIGDIELLEQLSGQKYPDYLVTLTKWKNFDESPIIQIGETWRLTSPLDIWTNFSSKLTPQDFQKIKECFVLAFKDGNPVLENNSINDLTPSFNSKRKYSAWSREGLAQSLILVGRLNDIKIPNLTNPQKWVDDIIFNLLVDASGDIWTSVDHELPLIAEASPESFLKSIKRSLANSQPEIMAMFREEEGFLHKTSHHTGLLWALESLAWLPEYLRDVSLILLQLSRLDPGGNLSNRPMNSISEIYKPWHYQTLAGLEERIEILKYISMLEPEQAWILLIRMLPDSHGIAHPTHKMRWRMFDKNIKINYTYEEIWKTHSEVIEVLLSIFDYSEKKFSQLIKETPGLSPNDRRKVLDWAENIHLQIKQEDFSTSEELRKILHHHRSHPETHWALPESELLQLERLYNTLQPVDVVNKYIWLFNDHWPDFAEGFKYEDNEFDKRHSQQQRKIDEARKEALIAIIKEIGLSNTIELRKGVKEYWIFGGTLASVVNQRDEIITVCHALNDDKSLIGFAHNFIYQKSLQEGFEWIKDLFGELQALGFNNSALSNFLIPLDQGKELWDFIGSLDTEIQVEYWQNFNPYLYNLTLDEKIVGIQSLLNYKRFFTAIGIAFRFGEDISTNLLAEILMKAATEQANEPPQLRRYEIERVFEEIDKRPDIDKQVLINLEWLYLPLLDSHGRRNPKLLEEELASNPEFFIEVLKWVYTPKDKLLIEKEREGLSDDFIRDRAKQAYHLLHSWKKIPGMKEDNNLDEVALKSWIEKARELAQSVSRSNVADSEIGKILAQYPENIPTWPQETIFKLIEQINTDSLKSGYSSAMFNKRGFSSRGVFDGGDIEREKASYFENLYNKFSNRFPNVAEIFKGLQRNYLADAQRMDESAERDRLEY